MTNLYIVVPCYNEEEVLLETSSRLKSKINSLVGVGLISPSSRIVFVDDGSRDRTWEIIENLTREDRVFGGIKLSRNRGHQNALLAGLMQVYPICDAAISIDADLQDDVDAIDGFVEKFHEGCDIVYGVRDERKTDSFFKRFTAESFYKFMSLMGANVVFNHADYRLMSKRALEAMSQYKEVNLFLRGIVPELGYKTAIVTYSRAKRFAGESKYNLKKMLALAFNGITSFSVKPIKLITGCGTISALLGALLLFVSLLRLILSVPAASFAIVGSIWLTAGIQLAAIGIVGEYIGKIYFETKARPRYIIDKFVIDTESNTNE